MKSRRFTFALALLASLAVAVAILGPAAAQEKKGPVLNVKLGLWEATTVTQSSGTPPIDTSGLSPEQRQRLEAMMAKSRKAGATPHTFKTCLTKEKLSSSPFEERPNRACKETVVSSTETTYDMKVQCTNEETGNMSGEWRFDAATPELVKANGHFTMENNGRKMDSTMNMTAKWIGASCGDVK